MNEQRFRIEYQRSENSVPVNTELTKKLIAMAKEYENAAKSEKTEISIPEITISRAAKRKRVRRIITELSAIAACAAICAYTIPKINDQYFDRSGDHGFVISTEKPEPHTDKTQKPDDVQPASQSDTSEKPAPDTNIPAAAQPKHQSSAAVNSAASVRGVTSATSNTKKNDVSEPDSSVSDASTGSKANYTSPEGNPEYSRSELDIRLDTIAKNNKKLEGWNDTLLPYSSDDDMISGFYASFSQSVSKYSAASEDFEKSYGSASDSGQIYEGIEKYDTELDRILFEACRSDYRKAKNYIEMNLADYGSDEPEEESAPEEVNVSAEPEVPEESEAMEGSE